MRAGQANTPDWSQSRGGPSHSGSTAATGPDGLESSRWAIGDESQPASFPAVVDGTAYVGVGTAVLAVDNAAGAGQWQTTVGARIVHSPAVGENNVFVTLEDGDLVALSRADGTEQWRVGLGGQPSPPTVADGTVYAGTTNDRIAAFDAASGSVVWTDDRAISLRNPDTVTTRPTPAYADGTVYVNVNSSDSGLVALDAETGDEQWTQWFSDPTEALVPAVADGTVALTFGYPDTRVTLLSTAGGIVQWEATLAERGTQFPAAVDDGLVAIAVEPASGQTSLLAYDPDTGEERWSYGLSDQTAGGVTIGADAVYLTAYSSGESLVAAVGRQNGFEQATRAIDFPTDSGYGPVPTAETLLVPDGQGLRALGDGSAADDPVATEDADPTVRQPSTDTAATERVDVTPNSTDSGTSGGGSRDVFSLEVAGTVATILAAIATIVQVFQGN